MMTFEKCFSKKLKEETGVDLTDFTSFEPILTTQLANYIHKCFLKRKETKLESYQYRYHTKNLIIITHEKTFTYCYSYCYC